MYMFELFPVPTTNYIPINVWDVITHPCPNFNVDILQTAADNITMTS